MDELISILDALQAGVRDLEDAVNVVGQPCAVRIRLKDEAMRSVPFRSSWRRLTDDDSVAILAIDAGEFGLGSISLAEDPDLTASAFEALDRP
jgi:hypothetical protein